MVSLNLYLLNELLPRLKSNVHYLYVIDIDSTLISFPDEYRTIQSKESGALVPMHISLGCEPRNTYTILCVIVATYLLI
jgi:hypothetical protein